MLKNQAHCYPPQHILKQEVMLLATKVLFPVGTSESCKSAADSLSRSGFLLTDHPSPDVTHLLLDIPSIQNDGLQELLRMLPIDIAILGYNLTADYLESCRKIDLQKDPLFLARNAAITAECALRAAVPYLTTAFRDTPTIILGWGRIGKCLANLLQNIGTPVTIAARKESDRAIAIALGHRAVDFSEIQQEATRHRLLFNTVPQGIVLQKPSPGCVKIDLASLPGLEGGDVIPARGLPGKFVPESAGKLIAESIIRLTREE